MLNAFVSRGLITNATPLFMLGLSNGAAMASRATYILTNSPPVINVTAAASYCAPGTTGIFNLTTVAHLWGMAQFDSNDMVAVDAKRQAAANRAVVAARSLAHSFRIQQPAPLAANHFARITGISLADSAAIVQSFRNRGLLDQNGCLLTNNAALWTAAVPAPFNVAAYSDEIGDQLMATYADHKFYSDDNAPTLAFFKTRLQ